MLKKTVIITGGLGDIGKATAEKFARNGYNVALTFLNSFDTDFIEKLKTFGVDVLALRCDQRLENDIFNFISSVFREFEYVDCLVACAGLAEPESLLAEQSIEVIDDIIKVNLRGTILFNREISKRFIEQKHGSIINISSIYGETGGSLESVYSACKAGIVGLTKSLAVELAPNIRVNCISPGCIDTKMLSAYNPEDIKYARSQVPLARLGTPADIANTAYFLASDDSAYITGENIVVSGGALRF